jgi:hypothetical protein
MARSLLVNSIGKENQKEHLDNFLLEGKLQNIVYPEFKIYVEKLISEHPGCHFVLRPHINENPAPWVEIGKKYSNVKMSLSGDVSQLLLETDILVHYNSTTSIEAAFYGKTVLTYIPRPQVPDDLYLRLNEHAMAVSHVGTTLAESLELASKALNDKLDLPVVDLNGIIAESSSEVTFRSSELMVEAFEKVALITNQRPFPGFIKLITNWNLIRFTFKLRATWLAGWVDHFFRIFRGKYAPSRNYYRYGKTKQGAIDMAEVDHLLKIVSEKIGKQIQVRKLKQGLLLVSCQK